jgi:hypothetical protein
MNEWWYSSTLHTLTLVLDGGERLDSYLSPFTLKERILIPSGKEAGWAPKPA